MPSMHTSPSDDALAPVVGGLAGDSGNGQNLPSKPSLNVITVSAILAVAIFICSAVFACRSSLVRVWRVWNSTWVYQQSQALLEAGRWRLAAYFAAAVILTILAGCLWRWSRFDLARSRQGYVWSMLLGAVGIAYVARACWAWRELALTDGVPDAVLVGLVIFILVLAVVGLRLGAGRRRFAALTDRTWLVWVVLGWLAIALQANQLSAVFAVGITLMVAGLAGYFLLHVLVRLDDRDWLDTLLFSLGLGLGGLGLFALLLGQLHLLYWWIIAPIHGLILWTGYQRFRPEISRWADSAKVSLEQRSLASHWSWALAGVVLAVILSMTLIGNFGPEVQGDAVMWRLAAPVKYVDVHSSAPCPYIIWSYSTNGSEILYALVMTLGGGSASGKLMHFSMGIAALTALLAFGRRWLDWRVGMIAVVTLASSSLVWWLLTSAYIDLTFLFYGLLASYALYRWLESDQRSWLVVSALTAGFTGGVKLTGGLLICPALLLVMVRSLILAGGFRHVRPYKDVLLYAVLAAVGVLPWLVRTWWYTGNPVYPFLMQVFNSSMPLSMQVKFTHRRAGPNWIDYLGIVRRSAFGAARVTEQGRFSPLFVALVPALAGLAILRRHQLWFASYTAAIITAWALTDVNLRYGLVQFALVGMIAAGVLVKSWEYCPALMRGAAKLLLAAAMATGLCYVLVCEGLMQVNDGQILSHKPWLGAITSDAHVQNLQPYRILTNYLNRTYGKNARVWCTYWQDSLAQQSDAVWTWFGKEIEFDRILNPVAPAKEIHQVLMDLGITHLVCHKRYDKIDNLWHMGPFTEEFVRRSGYCELEFAVYDNCLYRVKTPQASFMPRMPSGNLLGNPTFLTQQATLSSWDICGRLPAPPMGSSDARIAGGAWVNGRSYVQQTVPVTETGLYRLKVHARCNDAQSGLHLALRWMDAGGVLLQGCDYPHTELAGEGEVVQYESAPLGARTLQVKLLSTKLDEVAWIKDVELVRMDGP